MITLLLPIKTVSEANQSRCEHWGAKTRRKNSQKSMVKIGLYNFRKQIKGYEEYTVTPTRIAPSPQGQTLDGDNLQRSMKAVRDQVAEEIGLDDGSQRITWRYAQEKGKPKEYAVRIEIEEG